VFKWLGQKHSYLNAPSSSSSAAALTRRRHRDRPFNTLEIALYEWMKRMEVTLAIIGAILKTKALQFFYRMSIYNNQEEPKWLNGWLKIF